ncbi:unnamed protein product [Cyclocybe aegerita]|uniref:Uncharacterized protein n=1 Tax=Cyclocybe aegerita TaxID=1973307 RepID=A0A8S0W6F3_CYCAE|nr:unnamed protein product [Cyclocybe aegerita]
MPHGNPSPAFHSLSSTVGVTNKLPIRTYPPCTRPPASITPPAHLIPLFPRTQSQRGWQEAIHHEHGQATMEVTWAGKPRASQNNDEWQAQASDEDDTARTPRSRPAWVPATKDDNGDGRRGTMTTVAGEGQRQQRGRTMRMMAAR